LARNNRKQLQPIAKSRSVNYAARMPERHLYAAYIMASRSRTLYINCQSEIS
jgi:hypothetical protein